MKKNGQESDPISHIFECLVHEYTEPEMVYEAIELPHWNSSMQAKYDALMKNDTWKLVDLSLWKKFIRCKWVFKTKYKVDDTLDKHKS